MFIKDKVYGEVEIAEPALCEIINSQTLQRLKYIDQAGYRPFWVKNVDAGEYDYSRFTHSVGVCLLLRKYGAPLEEQIAGLIHDVSHSVFSHCIDYILKSGSGKHQNHQDNLFDCYVRKTEIPSILKKYGFDLDYILNDKNFPLKEKDLPDLCADRIDYSLRTLVIFNEINEEENNYFLGNLTITENDWTFKNFFSAKKFAEFFLILNKVYYSGLTSAAMFQSVGNCLKYALEKQCVSEDDLYRTDNQVVEKIKKYLGKDGKFDLLWERMNNKVGYKNNPNDYDGHIFVKSRIIDPLFIENGVLKRLSEADDKWKDIIKQESVPKEYFVKFDS